MSETETKYELPQRSIDIANEMLPDYMVGGLVRYFNNRIPPGSFLTAILSNDLYEAAARADNTNQMYLSQYVMWLHNYAPGRHSGSWGSPEAVKEWLRG